MMQRILFLKTNFTEGLRIVSSFFRIFCDFLNIFEFLGVFLQQNQTFRGFFATKQLLGGKVKIQVTFGGGFAVFPMHFERN
jgi:hypothetical protein